MRFALALLAAIVIMEASNVSRAIGPPSTATAVFPSGAEFLLEVAADDETRRLGYMFRDSVGAREGMVFLFDADAHHPIWMKNCRVSLDIVWLDAGRRVVDIVHEAKPCPERGPCPSLVPQRASRYVVEFQAGATGRERLALGDSIVLLAEPPLP